MKLNKCSILLALLFFYTTNGYPQSEKCSFNGYLSGMPQMSWTTFQFDSLHKYDRADQYLLHNRLNFHWYPIQNITGTIQFRNQLIYGDFIKDGSYESGFETEGYFLPLTYLYTFGDAGLLSLSADRAWMQYTHNSIEVKLGRQRINWGQTFVWNPNDIFNAYNFFDFDYVERPGVDAARVQFYPNFTSTIDIAVKVDSGSNITAAGLYRFNKWGTDFQVIGGYYSQPSSARGPIDNNESDWVGGAGITGDVKGVSIRTEATYMLPTEESTNQKELFLWSLGLDYSFMNELYLSSEFFYSSRVSLSGGSNIFELYSGPLTVKNNAFAKYNAFVQGSYPITPLFKITLSGMAFVDNTTTGYFLGPYLDYSLIDNLDLALYFQFFNFTYETNGLELKSQTSYAFLRLKWSF